MLFSLAEGITTRVLLENFHLMAALETIQDSNVQGSDLLSNTPCGNCKGKSPNQDSSDELKTLFPSNSTG